MAEGKFSVQKKKPTRNFGDRQRQEVLQKGKKEMEKGKESFSSKENRRREAKNNTRRTVERVA